MEKKPFLNEDTQHASAKEYTNSKIALIRSLLEDISNLPHRNDEKLDALVRRTKMIFTKIFGSKSSYLTDLNEISFHPGVYFSGMEDSEYSEAWQSGKSEMTNLLKIAFEEIELNLKENTQQKSSAPVVMSNKVFVVHGHDEEMKTTVARALEKLGLAPIILHEKADQGKTVIEKFIVYSEVQFAVVLFSPDDMAYHKNAKPETARPRARQNVVLELGFFLGKLGRERVLVLHRQAPAFELPSDYAGVLFKPFDDAGGWRLELVKELNALGFSVDANHLLK
jgi:predicted nucleotide-binding protein